LQTTSPVSGCPCWAADYDDDGFVDLKDFAEFQGEF
jgi:hypothetical protein